MATLEVAIDARLAQVGANQFDRATDKIERSARSADRRVDGLQRSLNSVGRINLGTLLVGGAGAGGLAAGLNVIGGYEEALVTLQGVSRATQEEIQRLNDTAQTLGRTTRFSAREAADGLTFLARAGFDANEALAAIPDTLNLAATSGLSLGEASDVASNVLRQFNLEAQETERVVDNLTNVANNANTNVQQLAQALVFAGPQAGAFGQSVEQTAASLGVLGDAGIQATLAGTNLRGIISTLIGPTTEGRKALERLGLTLDEVDPSANSLIDIFRRLRDANLDAASATEIFGRRNVGAALILAGSADRVEELTRLQAELAGETKRLAAEFEKTLPGRIRALKSAFEGLILTIGGDPTNPESGTVLSGMKGIIEFATEVVNVLAGQEQAIRSATPQVLIFAGALKLTVGLLGALIALKVAAWALSTAGAIGTLATAQISLSTATTGVVATLGPFVKLLTAVAAIIAGFEVGKLIGQIGFVQKVLLQAAAGFRLLGVAIQEFFSGTINTIKKEFNGFVTVFSTSLIEAIDEALEKIEAVAGFFGVWEEEISAARGALAGIGQAVEAANLSRSFEDQSEQIRKTAVDARKAIIGELGIALDLVDEELEQWANDPSSRPDLADLIIGDINKVSEALTGGLIFGDSSIDITVTGKAELQDAADEAERLQKALGHSSDNASLLEPIVREVKEATDDAADSAEEFAKFSGELLASSFEDAILQANSLRDITRGLLEDIARLTLRTFVTGPLGGALGNLFSGGASAGTVESANGNVIAGGDVVPFANGGVPRGMINSSVIFPMNNGRIGVAGEKGPEYGAEPVRLPNGKLGVAMVGGGGGTVVINVTTPDASSFSRSYRSIERRARRGLRRD